MPRVAAADSFVDNCSETLYWDNFFVFSRFCGFKNRFQSRSFICRSIGWFQSASGWRNRSRSDSSQNIADLLLFLDRSELTRRCLGTSNCCCCRRCKGTSSRSVRWKHSWSSWLGLDSCPKCFFEVLQVATAFDPKLLAAAPVEITTAWCVESSVTGRLLNLSNAKSFCIVRGAGSCLVTESS